MPESATNIALIERYESLISAADFEQDGYDPQLGEVAEAAAPLHLLTLLESAATRSNADAGSLKIARDVLKAFHAMLNALSSYRQDGRANPRYPVEIRARLLRDLRSIRDGRKRRRLEDDLVNLDAMLAERSLGREHYLALQQAAKRGGLLRYAATKASTAECFINGVWTIIEPERTWCRRLANADPMAFTRVLQVAIRELERYDLDSTLTKRLQELKKNPTKRKWSSAKDLMFAGNENAKKVARFRLRTVGSTIDKLRDKPLDDLIETVADDHDLIKQFANQLLDRVRKLRGTKRGQPPNPALQEYANAVGAAYRELTGRPLTITRPTPNSAPAMRDRTSGFGLDVMTAALQMIDPSLGKKQAQTAIERLPGKRKKRPAKTSD